MIHTKFISLAFVVLGRIVTQNTVFTSFHNNQNNQTCLQEFENRQTSWFSPQPAPGGMRETVRPSACVRSFSSLLSNFPHIPSVASKSSDEACRKMLIQFSPIWKSRKAPVGSMIWSTKNMDQSENSIYRVYIYIYLFLVPLDTSLK